MVDTSLTTGYRVAPLAHDVGVFRALTGRGMMRMRRLPALIVPAIVMPMFFVVAFSGSFSSLANVPGFPTPHVINWMTPYAILQGASLEPAAAHLVAFVPPRMLRRLSERARA